MEAQAYQDDLQNDLKVRLFPKKLESGKCQVKFFVNLPQHKNVYGYLLVDPEMSLKEVVHEIRYNISRYKGPEYYYQANLYSIGRKRSDKGLVFFLKD